MKKIMMMALTLALAGGMQAQTATSPTKEKKPDQQRMERVEKMTPEDRAKKKTAKLTEMLGLNAEQQKAVYEIALEQSKQRESAVEDREAMRTRSAEMRERSHAQISRVLTPEQREKWEAHKEERQEKYEERQQGERKQDEKREHIREDRGARTR